MHTIMIAATEDGAFCQHRLPMARALLRAGYRVVVVANVDKHRQRIEDEGFELIHWPLNRGSRNPFVEFRTLAALFFIYRRLSPDLLFSVGVKPNVYGSICRWLLHGTRHISLFAGLGTVFVAQTPDLKALRWFLIRVMRRFLTNDHAWVVAQNSDDQATLRDQGIGLPDRVVIVPGSGIDMSDFPPAPEPDDRDGVCFTMVTRMLWYKGVGEALAMAKKLHELGANVRIELVGDPDDKNPGAVSRSLLEENAAKGYIEWLGHRSDIAEIWRQSHVALLPSYGEGMSKTLLEAASTGRPLIAFDVPGCRDLIQNDVNGILVPFQDVDGLVDAVCRLAESRELRERMGQEARKIVAERFSAERIGEAVVDLVHKTFATGDTSAVTPESVRDASGRIS